ncbi:MAG: phage tail sheath C-terminal domain-containing protein [Bacteroidota bacterium]
MPSTYKTPGVYVEEISIFPPSVASVETAVPAFIGYTERADRNGESLSMKPTRVKSMVEFEEWFGSAPPRDVTVTLDDNDEVIGADSQADFYLYDSLRMYFANGGGKCYIVSVGTYKTGGVVNTVDGAAILNGLAKLEKEDEPTILLSPDATLLTADGLYDFQKAALAQCNKLQDRVALCDTKYVDDSNFDSMIADFRNKVGIQFLKYGAAYTPWLKTSLQHDIKYRDLTLERDGGGSIVLQSLTDDSEIKDFITNKMDVSVSVAKAMAATITARINDANLDSLTAKFNDLVGAVNDVPAPVAIADYTATLTALFDFLRDTIHDFINAPYLASLSDVVGYKMKSDLEGLVKDSGLEDAVQDMFFHNNALRDEAGAGFNIVMPNGSNLADIVSQLNTIVPATINSTRGTGTPNTNGDIEAGYAALSSVTEEAQYAVQGARGIFKTINAFVTKAVALADDFESTFDTALQSIFGTYKNILASVNGRLATLPPSSTIAGVYATVDANRGVWKAPANVSLNFVMAPSVRISHEEQAELNVDVNAGKSINAIRSFTGKGILVWGARTLAGNDNEWRYISVRRFYNMVEESVKKASEQFVFEPNDANTWVKVKGMIENYLTVLWRQGALAGAKTADAFFVKVGLGETMTSVDVLEGRMIVEIGMAVVRPAEFIILKFSHKMQES